MQLKRGRIRPANAAADFSFRSAPPRPGKKEERPVIASSPSRALRSALTIAMTLFALSAGAAERSKIRLDYSYYNPVGLVMKEQGWLEQEFAKDGIGVEWVLSQGSNKALEYLNGSSIDFGSTAGSAALLARANGNPIKA